MDHSKEIARLGYQVILIGLLSFIFPIWISTGINWSAFLLKIYQCFSLELPVWENKSLLFLLFLIAMIPFVYLLWFYYLTLKRIFQRIYDSVLVHWNREIANFLSIALIDWYNKSKGKNEGEELMVSTSEIMNQLLTWINERVENWPKVISWATKKLLKQIPFLDIILNYKDGTIPYNDHPRLVSEIHNKLNNLMEGIIEEIVPKWTMLVIPINLVLLFLLWYL